LKNNVFRSFFYVIAQEEGDIKWENFL